MRGGRGRRHLLPCGRYFAKVSDPEMTTDLCGRAIASVSCAERRGDRSVAPPWEERLRGGLRLPRPGRVPDPIERERRKEHQVDEVIGVEALR